jgi:hypothetical protein
VIVASDLERELQQLAGDLKRLEADYTAYFGGRLNRPPLETRARVEAAIRRLDRGAFDQLAQRFRFQTLQSRYATFAELWDRHLRQQEEGRPSLPAARREPAPAGEPDRVLHDAEIADAAQMDRVEELYTALVDARRDCGQQPLPFHRFAQIVREQLQQFHEDGAVDVRFRVAVREGKVRLTARARKTVEE